MKSFAVSNLLHHTKGPLAGAVLLAAFAAPAQEPQTAVPDPQPEPPAAQPAAPESDPGANAVRIVRLSLVRGTVQMDRNTGRGYEPAFANIPVIAGARLRTLAGVAEIEFEDNSSLRLAPNSEIFFSQLNRSISGATQTTVSITRGLVYAGLSRTKGNSFSLVDGAAHIALAPGVHLRLDATQPQGELAVFDGSAEVSLGSAVLTVNKKQTIGLNVGTQVLAAVEKGTREGDWDSWDKQENDFHKQKASFAGVSGNALYGANDLSYYGAFVDMPGCGSLWRPYFVSAAWDPFANGIWTWYPTTGYSWVSPYPWGWLPFHSGSWTSCGAAGWGWRPGSSWYGLHNIDALRIAKHPLPHPVPRPPARNAATLVPVNMKPLSISGMTRPDRFEFRRDSAGLGVPRSGFGNLHGFAGHVDRHGSASSSDVVNTFAGPMQAQRAQAIGVQPRYPGMPSNAQTNAPMWHGGPVASGGHINGAPGAMTAMPHAGGGGMPSAPMNMGSIHSGLSAGPSPAPSAGASNAGGGGGAHH